MEQDSSWEACSYSVINKVHNLYVKNGANGCIKSSVILQKKAQLIKTLEIYKEMHVVNYLLSYWTKSLSY